MTLYHRARRLIKADVFARDGGRCHYCHRNLSLAYLPGGRLYKDSATVDHLVERSRGGSRALENLVCCCDHCNRKRSQLRMSPEEFREWRRLHPFGPLTRARRADVRPSCPIFPDN